MNLKDAVNEVFKRCNEVGDDIQVTFDNDEVTIYWENLRLVAHPNELGKALKLIADAKSLGAYFE